MKTTEHYGLKKPEGSDFVSPAQFNENFDILDTALKVAAESVGAHTHSAEEIEPGTFTGEFDFASPIDLTSPESNTRFGRVQFDGENRKLQLLNSTGLNAAGEPTNYTGLQIDSSSSALKQCISVVRLVAGNPLERSCLYGEHNRPIVSGGYTGDGEPGREIRLGGVPTILFVVQQTIGASVLSVLLNFGELQDHSLSGFCIKGLGNNPTLSSCQVEMNGSKLCVKDATKPEFMNETGGTYWYWGMTI